MFSCRYYEALQGLPCDLLAVVDVPFSGMDSTNPLPPGLVSFIEAAGRKGIPVYAPEDPNTREFVEMMKGLAPDLFIAVGYALILKPPILGVPRLLAANFHASLLSHYRGKHPVFWTLRGGERKGGLTVHAMDAGIDTGDIIYQVAVRTRRDDTVSSLYERIMDRSVGLVGRLVADAEAGRIPRHPQAPGEGSYFSSTREEDFKLDWTWEAEKIRRYIQTTPGRCFTTIRGRRLALSQAETARKDRGGPAGTLLVVGRRRALIAAGDGAVWIGRGRIEGGDERSMASLCRELALKVGESLEKDHVSG